MQRKTRSGEDAWPQEAWRGLRPATKEIKPRIRPKLIRAIREIRGENLLAARRLRAIAVQEAQKANCPGPRPACSPVSCSPAHRCSRAARGVPNRWSHHGDAKARRQTRRGFATDRARMKRQIAGTNGGTTKRRREIEGTDGATTTAKKSVVRPGDVIPRSPSLHSRLQRPPEHHGRRLQFPCQPWPMIFSSVPFQAAFGACRSLRLEHSVQAG